MTLRKQRIEVTGFCCRNKHPAAGFSGSAANYPYQMPQANAYRAGPALATIPSSHALCVWLRETVRIYGSCVRRNEWPRRGPPPGLPGTLPLAQGDAAGRPRISPPGGGTAVPPDRHHLRRLWRRRSPGAADPLRRDPADHVGQGMDRARKGPEAAGPRAQHVPARHLPRPRHPARQHHPRRPDLPESGVPAGNERPGRAARRLRPYRRHRHRPGRRRQFHRAGGQCAHAVRRVLHAGKPRNHDAAVSGPVRPPPRRAGGDDIPTNCCRRCARWRR